MRERDRRTGKRERERASERESEREGERVRECDRGDSESSWRFAPSVICTFRSFKIFGKLGDLWRNFG